ncbi:MAG: DUF4290 domain-containing protein [Bacteroides sp.]|nr:DUF4290 domain-containing protein [Bacteroides sp.]
MPYNTSEKKLILPEYGRNIQRLIDHCVLIEDREERTHCAFAIADAMSVLFPEVMTEDNDKKKIWDHINIMSDFKLDIDFPCEVISKEQLIPEKTTIPYNQNISRFRHYGKNIQQMIQNVANMENVVEKDQLIFLIANQMKKLLITQNPEGVSDTKVFNDILEISKGKIAINPDTYRLNEYIGINSNNAKNKKKKK